MLRVIAVNRYATTLKDHTTVSALMVTNLMAMDTRVQVRRLELICMLAITTSLVIEQNIDIDECAEQLDDCDQNCLNYAGLYSCFCNFGFRLNEDELHCDGNVKLYSVHIIM